MKSSRLSPARIARSVVTVLTLTLIQTVGSPLINLVTPQASAATLYDNRSNFQQWETWRTSANHPIYDAETTNQISSNDQAFELTPNLQSKTGFIWNTQTVSLSRDFSLSAWYYLGASDAGADGIVFSMRPLVDWPNDGLAGGNNGDWSHWSSNELKVILDTYQNGSEIAQDHIRIVASKNGTDTNYSGSGVKFKDWNGTTVDDVENNTWYPLTIQWTGSTRLMSVYSGLSANYLITSATIPTTDFTLSEYNWGWMGFTGGASNVQQITGVNYHVGPSVSTTATDTTVTDGTSVTLTASYNSSESAPTTRWEYSTDGGSTWITTGTTSTSYTFTATRTLNQRKYRFFVSSTAAGATYSNATTPITLTVKPPLLRSETDTAINTASTRFFYAPNANSILPGTISTLTMEAWVKPSATCDGSYYCSIVASNNSVFLAVYEGKVNYIIGSGSAWCSGGAVNVASRGFVPSGRWTHVALVRNSVNVKIYVNGSLVSDADSSCNPTSMTAPSTQQFGIGYRHTLDQYFYGSIDEARIWNSDRSASISSDMNSNETATANLIGYWNFNEGSGGIAYNQVPTANSSSDLISYGTDKDNAAFWDAASISTSVTSGPYTVRTFYRTYLTSEGGWKAPRSGLASSIIVGGGGGGGGGGYVSSGAGAGGGGGGGAGGAAVQNINLVSGSVNAIVVGVGGAGSLGGISSGGGNGSQGIGGSPSSAFQITAAGGGPGYGAGWNTTSQATNWTDGTGGIGGYSGSSFLGGAKSATAGYGGASGAGATASGSTPTSISGAVGGNGLINSYSGTDSTYSVGGSGGNGSTTSATGATGATGAANSGNGGAGGTGSVGGSTGAGGNGGSGIVIIRWITAAKPTFTQPQGDTTTAGLTDTMTVSANPIAPLTRNFQWQFSTDTGTTWSNASTGSGANTYTYTTATLETNTSGIRYQYRVVVTDSDIAGLYIVDTSSAIYLVINPRISYSGSYTTQKYGSTHQDTFTVSNGTGIKALTFMPNNRTGITWDTSTANSARLTIGSGLNSGTYYETITATDSKGAQTLLPLSIVVSKADTITVATGASLTTVYTGIIAGGAPKAVITGLVGADTATVSTNYYSVTCAQGGLCKIGDVGPGGGNIFYISDTVIDSATGVSSGGIYLEAAPRNWNGDATNEAGSSFASVLTSVSGTSSAIGTGAENSRLLIAALGTNATAATLAVNKTSGGVSDWFVPSYDELTKMITVLAPLGLGSFTNYANLWSSTQNSSDSQRANNAWSSNPPVLNTLLKTDNFYLRPIRAFSPTVFETSTPVDVETYTAIGANLTFLSGTLSNYQGIVYETSTLKITQANQNKLTLNLYGAVAGSPFTLQVGGGSGSGEVIETVTAGSTALNCRISNHVLSNDTPSTEQKSCNISITKASSRNYKAETLTATVYFMLFANNQPTGLVGSGSTIAINGATSLTIDTTTPPSITGFSTLTLTLSTSDTLTINGTGFTGSVTIKFWRNKVIVKSSPNTTSLQIPFSEIASLGATSGRVAVITANGEAVSVDSLTINP